VIPRTLSPRIRQLAEDYPVVFLTGPRQSGKTTLARATFDSFRYLSLEDLQTREEALEDPRGFLRRLEGSRGAILDEIQRAPDLFSYIQGFADERRGGPLILTGSQHFLLLEKISQSLAGRAAILELLPFSMAELCRRKAMSPAEFESGRFADLGHSTRNLDEVLFNGMYPAIHDRDLEASTWLDGYLRTYVERDVRTISNIGDLDTFLRFLGLCAGRSGQLVNRSSLGADAGVDQTTVSRWISVLQAGYVVDILRPHFENFSRRLVKSPKLYFTDTGLLCRLLGVRNPDDLRNHPLRGAIFETFVVSEIRKLYLHHGQRPPLYFWRDSNGREIDVLVDAGTQRIPVEIKSAETVARDFLKGLETYLALSGDPWGALICGGSESYRRRGHWVRPWFACT
jgi:predicted AAA+ superfamily ATPase